MSLAPVTDSQGRTIGWATPGQPLLAQILRQHAADVAAQAAHSQAVRAGLLPPAPRAERWDISDRH